MGKRIRHLEFYGYPDQNVFRGPNDVDLSDINETNREQDEIIGRLIEELNEKADKSYADDINERLESFIEKQKHTNHKHRNIIDGLFDDLECVDQKIKCQSKSLNEHIDEFNHFTQCVDDKFNEYAKRDDVYTIAQADDTFLKKGDVDNFIDDEEFGKLKDNLENINESVSQFEEQISEVSDKIDGIEGKINGFDDKFDSIRDELTKHSEENEESFKKIDELLKNFDGEIEGLDNLATKTQLTEAFTQLSDELSSKADSSYVEKTKEVLKGEIEIERQERVGGDLSLQNDIKSLSGMVKSLSSTVENNTEGSVGLSEKLDKEISDRKDGDLQLIGKENDTYKDDTINGAKRYSEEQAKDAEDKAKDYTDKKFDGVDNKIRNAVDGIEQELTLLASKAYVEKIINDRMDTFEEKVKKNVEKKIDEIKTLNNEINSRIDSLESIVNSIKINRVVNRLNAITTYQGTSPEDYEDNGNGILDVLHKEFHKLKNDFDKLKTKL